MTDASSAESAIVIRDVESIDEIHAIEALQAEVWGGGDLDVVPLTILVAMREVGGILVGAFDGDTMVGFAFAFIGYENRLSAIHLDESAGSAAAAFNLPGQPRIQPVMHSHMLAVKREYRNLDLGRKLKLAQRERALRAGFNVMTWTFDPLQCINAHLNFAKLGVVSDEYKINFYGEQSSSFLHQNGTDRLWLTWPLSSARVNSIVNGVEPEGVVVPALTLVLVSEGDAPVMNDQVPTTERPPLAIEIPGNISDIARRDLDLSIRWREATRSAFLKALSQGYLVTEFHRCTRNGIELGYYVLTAQRIEDLV